MFFRKQTNKASLKGFILKKLYMFKKQQNLLKKQAEATKSHKLKLSTF